MRHASVIVLELVGEELLEVNIMNNLRSFRKLRPLGGRWRLDCLNNLLFLFSLELELKVFWRRLTFASGKILPALMLISLKVRLMMLLDVSFEVLEMARRRKTVLASDLLIFANAAAGQRSD